MPRFSVAESDLLGSNFIPVVSGVWDNIKAMLSASVSGDCGISFRNAAFKPDWLGILVVWFG